jgi:hypothetical protein
VDLLRIFPRLLAAFSRALVQKATSLRGLVQKGPALVEARFIGDARLGDPASEGASHGRKHPLHASSASAWGSTAILGGLPKISGRGGDEALEGPGSAEVVLLSPLGSGAALSSKGAALVSVGAAGVAKGASGVLVVLAVVGAAGTALVVSGVPPVRGGSVVPGSVAAPTANGASADARSSFSPATHGGVAGVVVDARSGLGVVWLVFLFFLLFFLLFFSSFFSERLRRASHSPDLASSSSRSPEAMGPAPLATESYSELAAGALRRGSGMMPSARSGP